MDNKNIPPLKTATQQNLRLFPSPVWSDCDVCGDWSFFVDCDKCDDPDCHEDNSFECFFCRLCFYCGK